MQFPALKEAQGRLEARQADLHKIFDEAGPDLDMSKVKSVDGDSAAKAARIRELDTEINDLTDKVKELEETAGIAAKHRQDRERQRAEADGGGEKGADGDRGQIRNDARTKSFGELFTDSAAYKRRAGQNGPEATLDIELKTLFETGNGWAPETTRTGRVVEYATRPIQVIDLIPSGTTTQSAVVYMEETTFTNNAAETAEGAQYPESALKLTEVTESVRKIATWLPITDEQLEDEPQARGYINNRLPFMLRQRLDLQILVGNGTAPNLRGITQRSGIQTQAKGADPTPDAFYKAMTKVKVTGQAMPNAHVMHPNDWQEIRLLRIIDGIYIWGSPSEAAPARLWGLPVIEAQVMTEGTGLTGDFANFSELTTRRGIDVQISNSHADFFINGKQAVRADVRVALCVYRAAAFATVTGI
jgi:HK97 family phage major capsid protein